MGKEIRINDKFPFGFLSLWKCISLILDWIKDCDDGCEEELLQAAFQLDKLGKYHILPVPIFLAVYNLYIFSFNHVSSDIAIFVKFVCTFKNRFFDGVKDLKSRSSNSSKTFLLFLNRKN